MAAVAQAPRPDSTGYACMASPTAKELVIRLKVAEQTEMSRACDSRPSEGAARRRSSDASAELGAKILEEQEATEYAFRLAHQLRRRHRPARPTTIEDVEGAENPDHRARLELIRTSVTPTASRASTPLRGFVATHAIATRAWRRNPTSTSARRIPSGLVFADVSLVHQRPADQHLEGAAGSERRGHRFVSNCDSELIAVYCRQMNRGSTLKDAMNSLDRGLDGVFHLPRGDCRQPRDGKDVMAAKPMCFTKAIRFIGSLPGSPIRSISPTRSTRSIRYEGDVRVWANN